MIADCLLIIFISTLTAFFSEGMTWLLVYRGDQYKRLKAEIERETRKLEKRKESSEFIDKSAKKKIERQEEKLKFSSRELNMVKMKSMFAVGLAFAALFSTCSSIFEGRAVAKLPFVPISFIRNISHSGLLGSDMTDCSFMFFYILCTMSIRQNVQKLLGFNLSRAASKQFSGGMFAPQQNK